MKLAVLALASALLVLLAVGALAAHLLRPLNPAPVPAQLACYELDQGSFQALPELGPVVGVGLSYAAHIAETSATYDPGAPMALFIKQQQSLTHHGATVTMPTAADLAAAAEALEPGAAAWIDREFSTLTPLLDYEVELGFVLLETVDAGRLDDPDYAPRLGFFVANDLSARSLGLMGEGQAERYAYWGASKSFPGFLPVGDRMWVPERSTADTIPCVELRTEVNSEQRQAQTTLDLVYTPKDMLAAIHRSRPELPLEPGLAVLTGTPGGVAISTPRALVRASQLLGLGRRTKLNIKLGKEPDFLQPGDQVRVSAGPLGEVAVRIVEAPTKRAAAPSP